MIISASRRTDIPAFYFPWFINRLKAGACMVRNPFNPKQEYEVSLKTEDVDAIVLWSKNPAPCMHMLDEVEKRGFRYLFLFTLNDYPASLEPHVPPVSARVRVFRDLADRIGSERVIWRYDPVIISNLTGYDYHEKAFAEIARKLEGSTSRVITSVVDFYRKTERRLKKLEPGLLCDRNASGSGRMKDLMKSFSSIAADAGIQLQTCAEEEDCGVKAGACIDGELIRDLWGIDIDTSRDRGQRAHCLCTRSKDIGAVDTCLHGCTYCYSTRSHEAAITNGRRHDPSGPFLLT